MKKILSSIVWILIFTISIVKAQSDQSAPTKEDAVSFLKMVEIKTHDIPPQRIGVKGHFSITNIDLSLNGCILNYTYNFNYLNYDHSEPDESSIFSFSIDLSKVGASKDTATICSTLDGKGFFGSLIHVGSLTKDAIRATYNGGPFTNADYRDCLDIFDGYDSNFKENNYVDRALKALKFLIKECGGGKVTIDPDSKF
jgi:hypothetical protein